MVRLGPDARSTGAGGGSLVYREVFLEEIDMAAGVDALELAVEDVADEVSRQRRKHWEASLNRPVAGFADVTLRQVVAEVEGTTAVAVGRFLAGRGHTAETIRTVQDYLELQRALESRRGSRPAGSGDHAAYARRARMLDELQSRLLDD
jgi:hypothetical protein